jgi:hypothetical protein
VSVRIQRSIFSHLLIPSFLFFFLSDIEVDTIRDIIQDEMENFHENPPETTNPKLLPMKIVFSSVGNINFRDIEIAYTAEAKIISYNVTFEKTALQLAKVSKIGGYLVFLSIFINFFLRDITWSLILSIKYKISSTIF